MEDVCSNYDRGAGKNHYENPFDITKIWRKAEFPLIEVGVLELNRNPENYFAEVEQSAFTRHMLYLVLGLAQTVSYREGFLLMEMRSATA